MMSFFLILISTMLSSQMFWSGGFMMMSHVLGAVMFMLLLFGWSYMGVYDMKCGYLMTLDMYSYLMIMLTLWVIIMCYYILLVNSLSVFYMNLIFFSLVLSFMSSSIYMYYIFFEFSLVPMFLLILGLGVTQDRLLAGLYMFIYTMFSSIPFLFVIIYNGCLDGFLSFDMYYYGGFKLNEFLGFMFMLFFMVKIPVFMLHIWLPKAHVEAPVYGSMILAAIMLKLGGYGFIRMMDMYDSLVFWGDYVISISIYGMVILGLLCMYVNDMKVLVAYSSVIHMCMMMCGFFSFSMVGFLGGLIMMISHGICSSGMFMMVNFMYERSSSRLMIFNKGFIGLFPMFCFFWLFMVMDNIGAPPSLSMVGEIYCLISLSKYCWFYFLFLILGLFFISVCMINLYTFCLGEFGGTIFKDLSVKDYYLIFYHLYPLNVVIMFLYCLF